MDATRALLARIDGYLTYIRNFKGYEPGRPSIIAVCDDLRKAILTLSKSWPVHPYESLVPLLDSVKDLNVPVGFVDTLQRAVRNIPPDTVAITLLSKKVVAKVTEAPARSPPRAPEASARSPPRAPARSPPRALVMAPEDPRKAPDRAPEVSMRATATGGPLPERSVGIIPVCMFNSAGTLLLANEILKDDKVYDRPKDLLVRAAQLIGTIFKFDSVLQPIVGREAIIAATMESAAAAEPLALTNAQKRELIMDTFCSSHVSLIAGMPVQACYAVVDTIAYKRMGTHYVHQVLGACLLARATNHWAIWSVAGDPYRIRANTFHHMFYEIKKYVRSEQAAGGPVSIGLIASDAPVPFVTMDDRIALYGREGFQLQLPAPPMTGVDRDGRWGDIPIPNDGSYRCVNLKNPGDRCLMTYVIGKSIETGHKVLELVPSIPMDIRPFDVLFSWSHSALNIKNPATAPMIIPVNTGNTRVIVSSVPASAIYGVYGLYLHNILIDLLTKVPFSMLLKLFPGIRLTKPLQLAHGGLVTQAFSEELYGGVLIKLPSITHMGDPAFGPRGISVTNFISIYVYDVNTDIPDMIISYSDPNKAREATFGMYQVDQSIPFAINTPAEGLTGTLEGNAERKTKVLLRSKRVPGMGILGTDTTLGATLSHINSVPSATPRVLLHGMCGSIDGGNNVRESAAEVVAERLMRTHPRAVHLNSLWELNAFYARLSHAIVALAQQVEPVTPLPVAEGGKRQAGRRVTRRRV